MLTGRKIELEYGAESGDKRKKLLKRNPRRHSCAREYLEGNLQCCWLDKTQGA
jgi:hypothetical protein